jgi:hypothetical protein
MARKCGFARGWRLALVAALLCCATVSVWAKKKQMSDDCLGTYNVEFRGALTGIGTARVSPNKIQIDGNLTDKSGNAVQVSVTLQITDDGHIKDSSYAGGMAMTVSGRVDPRIEVAKVPRVNCTYQASGMGLGRIVGHQ